MKRLAPIRHTGRHLPHHHTSYAALGFLLLITTVVTAVVTSQTLASDVGVIATVPEPAPTRSAVITSPNNDARFTANPIAVSGTCSSGTLVKIFANEVFAGAALCSPSGSFSLSIDLFIGRNELIARVYNKIDLAGPDSNTVVVYYDLPGVAAEGLPPFRLLSNNLYRGVYINQEAVWKVEIVGGSAPYAISWDWGDGRVEPYSRAQAGEMEVKHVYDEPGPNHENSYIIKIQGIDNRGTRAFLQLVAIVNPADVAGILPEPGNWLGIAWPLLVFAGMLLLAFYLGERREKRLLERQQQTMAPPSVMQ